MQKDLFVSSQLDEVYEGRIAEHIVGQELRAISKSLLENLSFWTREEKHADAEVNHQFAVRVYSGKLKIEKTRTLSGKSYYLLNLPFYLAHQIDAYLNLMIHDPMKLSN